MAYFPGVGAFEQLFFQKFKCPGGGGMLKLRFDWYISGHKTFVRLFVPVSNLGHSTKNQIRNPQCQTGLLKIIS